MSGHALAFGLTINGTQKTQPATAGPRNNRKRQLDSLWMVAIDWKRIKLLHDLLLKCTIGSRKTQTRNPGFSRS